MPQRVRSFKKSLPLHGGGRLGGDVVADAIDVLDLAHDAAGDLIQQLVGQAGPCGGHEVLRLHRPQGQRVVVGALLMTDEEGYSKDLETKMHQTIKKVSNDFENLKYNTAIAAMMTLLNDFYKKGSITRGELKTLIILLNPVAPHITEEMWQIIGCEGRVYQQTWPEFDEAKTVESSVEIAVQINGKVKGTLGIQKDDPKDQVIAKAKEVIADKLTGNIVKEIYVPGRLVNIVMK